MLEQWKHDAEPIQQAARSIVCHYEGEAWKPPLDDFYARVHAVSRLIAAAPHLFAALRALLREQGDIQDFKPLDAALEQAETAIALASPAPADAEKEALMREYGIGPEEMTQHLGPDGEGGERY